MGLLRKGLGKDVFFFLFWPGGVEGSYYSVGLTGEWLFFPEKGMRSQALHSCVTSSMCSPYCTFPPPPGCCCFFFFFLVADSQWTSIYILLDRFLFLYRKRWWVFHHKEKKKKRKKNLGGYSDIGNSGEHLRREKKKAFLLFYSLNLLLNHPSSAIPSSARGGRAHIRREVVFGWLFLFYFVFIFFFINLRVLEQNAGICRA